jgi:hypothetical protein
MLGCFQVGLVDLNERVLVVAGEYELVRLDE